MDNNKYHDEATKKQKVESNSKEGTKINSNNVVQASNGKANNKLVDSKTNGNQKKMNGTGTKISNNGSTNRYLFAGNQQNVDRSKPFSNSSMGDDLSSFNLNSMDEGSTDNVSDSEVNNNSGGNGILSMVWNKLSFKYKMIAIGVVIAALFVFMFLLLLIAPLMYLGIIPTGNDGGSSPSGYNSVSNAFTYYFPIGSSNVTTKDGISYADGTPVNTSIVYNSDSMEVYPIDNTDIYIIAVSDGTVIYPTADAPTNCSSTLSRDSCGDGYGNHVKIEHGDGNVTVYAHLESVNVNSGDKVKQGQVIGKMGSSGNTDEVKLRFEVISNGKKYNPGNYFDEDNPRPQKYTGILSHVNGTSNKQTVCLTLKNSGFPTASVAGLMTNINAESGFRTDALGDNGTSYGLCQWHNSRWDNLKSTFPSSYHTVAGQLEFLMYELKNYDSLYSSLVSGSKSASDLTYDFCYKFERPYDKANTCRKRSNGSGTFVTYVNNGCN